MSNKASKRIEREIRDILKFQDGAKSHIKLEMNNGNFTVLKGEISGPLGTPYEGATFELDIQIPESYPFKPPRVKFLTKVWHPNISSVTGVICLDILSGEWAAVLTLRTVMISLQALLSAAEPDDPLDAVVAKQYKETPNLYKQTARHWANVFAGGPNREIELEEKIEHLKSMGFKEESARIALSNHSWNIEKAMEFLAD